MTATIDMTVVEREASLAQIAAREHLPIQAESFPDALQVRTMVVYYDRNGVCGYKVTFIMGQLSATRVDSDQWSFQHHGQARDNETRRLRDRKPKIRTFQVFDKFAGRDGFRSTRKEKY